jgi:hypothetical protein
VGKYYCLWECVVYNLLVFTCICRCLWCVTVKKLWLYVIVYNYFCLIWCVINVGIFTHRYPFTLLGNGYKQKVVPVDRYRYGWQVKFEITGTGIGWLHPYPCPAGAIPNAQHGSGIVSSNTWVIEGVAWVILLLNFHLSRAWASAIALVALCMNIDRIDEVSQFSRSVPSFLNCGFPLLCSRVQQDRFHEYTYIVVDLFQIPLSSSYVSLLRTTPTLEISSLSQARATLHTASYTSIFATLMSASNRHSCSIFPKSGRFVFVIAHNFHIGNFLSRALELPRPLVLMTLEFMWKVWEKDVWKYQSLTLEPTHPLVLISFVPKYEMFQYAKTTNQNIIYIHLEWK